MTIDGAASQFNVHGRLVVGQSGTGSLTVSGGATVEAGSIDTTTGLIVGYINGSNGMITVTDSGSSLTVQGPMQIGAGGVGILLVQNQASAASGDTQVGTNGTGTMTITGNGSHWATPGDLTIGVGSGQGEFHLLAGATAGNFNAVLGVVGGSGNATIDGNGTMWTNAGTIFVGADGIGTLTIQNGATVLSGSDPAAANAAGAFIANATGSVGTATVSGANTSWTSPNLFVIGKAGAGSMSVLAGASASDVGTYVGNDAGSTGTLTIDGTNTVFSDTSTMNIGYDGTGMLNLTGGATLNSPANPSAVAAILAFDAGAKGTAILNGNGTAWKADGNAIIVGFSGQGSLSVQNGARVNSGGDNGDNEIQGLLIASEVGSQGDVTVTGAGTAWTSPLGQFEVGRDGTGTLRVAAGAAITTGQSMVLGFDAGSSGTLTVDGTNSTVAIAEKIRIGESGTGQLNITAGGALLTNSSATTTVAAYIGNQAGSNGMVLIDGANSTWNATGYAIIVGQAGSGAMTVQNGGFVVSGSDTAPSLVIAESAGSTGSVTLTGVGTSWNAPGQINVGQAGTGTLIVTSGASISTGFLMIVGGDPGGHGAVTIDGASTSVSVASNMIVGYSGNGTLSISSGGTLTSVASQATGLGGALGYKTGSIGTVTIDGAGSIWNAGESGISIGAAGAGTLTVRNGGAMVAGSANPVGSLPSGVVIGEGVGAAGNLFVDGADSTFHDAGLLEVGRYGTGTVILTNGGQLQSAGGSLGSGSNGNGIVTVDGAGSKWDAGSGNLIVGQFGAGSSLAITGGGTVVSDQASTAVVAANAESQASVSIDGANSMWQAQHGLIAGSQGAASISITNGGQLRAGDGMAALTTFAAQQGSSATVTLDGANSALQVVGGLTIGQAGDGAVLNCAPSVAFRPERIREQ